MEKVTIFTRGISRGNPGPAAIGVLFVDSKGKVLGKISESIGNSTNEYAEFFAVVRGMHAVVEFLGDKTKEMEFELKLSNEVLKKQLNAEHQIKDVGLIGSFIEVYNVRVESLPNLVPVYIEPEQNIEAEKLAIKALDA
ncbi:reverse transcriptase-like protein [Candidatus Kaiserbacteria bacterium]|nr:reverse transcriptase-like protein [Candidatus Kaiserbacteria bacterium]